MLEYPLIQVSIAGLHIILNRDKKGKDTVQHRYIDILFMWK